jgi:hypothetical protein
MIVPSLKAFTSRVRLLLMLSMSKEAPSLHSHFLPYPELDYIFLAFP